MQQLPSQENLISFEDVASMRGYCPQRYNGKDFKSVSHILKAKGRNGEPISLRFDVKKNKNLKQSQDWMWVEFKNANGDPGWIHGDAHFIVFERNLDFIVVNREELLKMLSSGKKVRYDLPFVNLAKKSKYRIYKRAGKKDEITQINIGDVEKLNSCKVWLKKDATSE